MDNVDSYKTNLNTVKEIILDEEKLVTYITLSKDLCIHVNNSKQLLCSAVQKIREEQPTIQLNISYIISGISGINTATTKICTENDLDNIKKSLSVVFFYHIYSVCKGSPLVDQAAFLLLNKFEDYGLCHGLIRSKECIKRSSDEIENLKTYSQEAVVLENNPSIVANKKQKPEPKHVSEASTNGQVEETKAAKETKMKSETKIKVEVTSPKKESNNKQNFQKVNGLKAQKGIASFFNKSNSLQTNGIQKKKINNDLDNKKPSSKPVDIKLDVMDVDIENNEIEVDNKKEVIGKKLNKESKSKEEKKFVKKEPVSEEKNKALNKIKKSSKLEKKRKRVLHVSDSEGDEDDDPFVDKQESNNVINNESDDEIPPTPSANSIKITSGIVNPKKRRKVVDKTYTDEEGYILTKKEVIYESCSENEDEVKVDKDSKAEKEVKKVESQVSPSKTKKNSPKKSKKKISPPQKGKQPTLNSFFSRK